MSCHAVLLLFLSWRQHIDRHLRVHRVSITRGGRMPDVGSRRHRCVRGRPIRTGQHLLEPCSATGTAANEPTRPPGTGPPEIEQALTPTSAPSLLSPLSRFVSKHQTCTAAFDSAVACTAAFDSAVGDAACVRYACTSALRANSSISAMRPQYYDLLEEIVILGVIYGSLVWRVCNPAAPAGPRGIPGLSPGT